MEMLASAGYMDSGFGRRTAQVLLLAGITGTITAPPTKAVPS